MAAERESIEVDVLFVGAGPSGLSGAIHLAKRLAAREGGGEASIMVIDKGREVGAHGVSGAVLNPRALDELIPDWRDRDPPLPGVPVREDRLYFLTERGRFRLPILPFFLDNRGNHVISLARFARWLAPLAEAAGVDVFPEFPGVELLRDGDRVIGVRTGDKGVGKDGEPKPNFEPGIDILAKVTVLSEGPRGTLAKVLRNDRGLPEGHNPQSYSLGVKEVWEAPESPLRAGDVVHTLLWPLSARDFGGGFLYALGEDLLCVGMVVGLGNPDPCMNTHERLQRFKTHPFVSEMLRGGQIVEYGAKTIPEGGYYAMPRLHAPGVLLTGDSAGFLDARSLKGIHLAMKSGMLAAETIVHAMEKDDYSDATLGRFAEIFESSWAREELYRVRNFHQAFDGGLWRGILHAGLQMVTGGRGLRDPMPARPDHERVMKVRDFYGRRVKRDVVRYDNEFLFDKVTDVYHSGTRHEEDQPLHLRIADTDICRTRCTEEYGNPCESFCPANVYEMEPNENGDGRHLKLNATNCVHCKTCDIMDPYGIITWVPPEGGGGPNQQRT